MNLTYKIIRAVIVVAIALAVTVPALLYIGLSLPNVQERIAGTARDELSERLGADVEIGSLTISPFSRLMLRDVSVTLEGDTVMSVDRLGAGINLYELTMNRRIVVNYVEIVGLDMKVSRDSLGTPLNIQPIIDRLKSKDENKPKQHINLAVNTIILRNCSASYDVDSIPAQAAGHFSPHHIALHSLSADLRLPAVGTDSTEVDIKRFIAKEKSGLEISNLVGKFAISAQQISWSDIQLSLPSSELTITGLELENPEKKPLDKLFTESHINIGLQEGSYITPADLGPLANRLANITEPIMLDATLNGVIDERSSIELSAASPNNGFSLSLSGILNSPTDTLRMGVDDLTVNANLSAQQLNRWLDLNEKQRYMLNTAKQIALNANGNLNRNRSQAEIMIATDCGDIEAVAVLTGLNSKYPIYDFDIVADQLQLGKLLQRNDMGMVEANASASGTLINKRPQGEAMVGIDRFDWNGHPFGDITATLNTKRNDYTLTVVADDPAAQFVINADGTYDKRNKSLLLASHFDSIDLGEILPGEKWDGNTVKFKTNADLEWSNLDDITGRMSLRDIVIDRTDKAPIQLNGADVALTTLADGKRIIDLKSDLIDGEASGDIFLSTLGKQIKEMSLESLPTLAAHTPQRQRHDRINNFMYRLQLHDTEQWAEALKLPVSNLGESEIHGMVNYAMQSMNLNLNAPYLRQGNKLIESTMLQAMVDGSTKRSKVYFTTKFPTKHGPLTLDLNTDAADDRAGCNITWAIDRAARYDGNVSLSAKLNRLPSGVHALVTLNPGNLTFNDSTWTINRATIDISPTLVVVDGINAHRSGQFVKIEGRASHLPDDEITIDLLGVNLDYIFESLGIDKVMLGGDATGTFQASNLFSKEPRLLTEGLRVKNISYNKVILGDALVKSHWDQDARAITLDATVDQPSGDRTLIDGAIFPLNDSIDITFDAHNINVAFMHPYMKAFASEISGRANGVARLWGNFKYIDMEGDIAADNLKIKIAFTNTSYTTSDTVKLRLGEITLNNVTLKDMYGNSAKLNGHVWHKFFKEPSFDFTVSDANNLLVYDESALNNPDWYGRIFGNGGAHIDGKPGVVNIKVDMNTAPGSTFTFVLNDLEEASDYTFITFRDRDKLAMAAQEEQVDETPSTVRRLREMLAKGETEEASAYNIDLLMDINPNAQINLVMDPVGGDRIKSWGNGNLRMLYESHDNELHMYGSYTLEQGNYNFTLQDIIIKDFTIKQGSSISFTGDPFSALLDIKAAYGLTANLTDLDESFSQDKDLNRTTVPVNALLKVSGALQQPEIGFDLEFPTLTQDTYRKVRSIVSTEDMMNRQIIYLLALGRFYTPDYMATSSRGNELASVASSTISSQLGNILGNISDKWNIAPTFRSDRGDFSDVEVDVALSSSLLNNRLLFNGNFGYRDKSLNNTQFVGDFDLEYLLNRAGTVRLKAYNRYNDMNYYVRTAETTQGVGISFRRNFDNLTELIHSYRKKERKEEREKERKEEVAQPIDSINSIGN